MLSLGLDQHRFVDSLRSLVPAYGHEECLAPCHGVIPLNGINGRIQVLGSALSFKPGSHSTFLLLGFTQIVADLDGRTFCDASQCG